MAMIHQRFIKRYISQFVETLSRHSLEITAAAVVSCAASQAHADALPTHYNSNTLTQNTGTLNTDQQSSTWVTIWNSNQTYQNTSTGQIIGANDSWGSWNNISVLSGGSGNAFVNDGQMSGGRNIYYSGDQSYTLNNGTINSYSEAIAMSGPASIAKNVGTINLIGSYASTAMGYWGAARTASTYATLINSGTINLGHGNGLFAIGAHTTIQNLGQIVGSANTTGIVVQAYPWDVNYSANYVNVNNSGSISVGQSGFGVDISGRNGLPSNPTNLPLMYGDSTLNSGIIESSSADAIGIRIGQYTTHATVTNSQTGLLHLSGNQSTGIKITSSGNAESVYNFGFIKVTGNQSIGINIDSNGAISNNQANGIGVLNSQSGTIYGYQSGLLNNYASITSSFISIDNSGLFGVYYDSNNSQINSTEGISNWGVLAGTGAESIGIRNIGLIQGTNAGVWNGFGGSISGFSYGIYNSGVIGDNYIPAEGIYNGFGGSISASDPANGIGIYNTNSGSITGWRNAIYNGPSNSLQGPAAAIKNLGVISSLYSGIGNQGALYATSSNGVAIYNTGSIEGSFNGGIFNERDSNNSWAGNVTGRYVAIYNSGRISSSSSSGIYNSANIGVAYSGVTSDIGIQNVASGSISGQQGIYNTAGAQIYGTSKGIDNSGSITSIVNAGSITGGIVGISNSGSITALINAQGGSIPLSYSGTLPTYYNIIVNSPTQYGKLAATGVYDGPMTFNIYGNTGTASVTGLIPSALSLGTYTNVLSGFNTLTRISGTSGIYGAFRYSLISGSSNGAWDLLIGPAATDITTSSGNLKTALGDTLNRRFDGGVLTVDNTTTDSSAFTVTSNNGTIDQKGLRTRFSGAIANDGVSPGKLIIANTGAARTGAIELTGSNTYSGGTDVQSGAVLSIASASALGSGALNLIGSATVPATLETTQTMTISNPITVSGDPVFTVAPTTTLTVSNPITDGASAGDVVASGGGTLNLTAENTYTGPTIVDAGSTLALSGSGSITTSNALTNNGTFDLTSATNIVNLGGTFTQTSTGTTNLVGSSDAFQKIVIGGAASLSGTLELTAASGSYRIGRYTLLNAGSISGTFSSFSNNLASVTSLGYTLSYDASNVYLNLAPNSTATLQSIQQNGQALGAVINMQAAALQAGLSYDCVKYDENNLCISVGGRYTYAATGPSGNAQAGLVIVGYRPTLTTRFGAFADQSANISTPNNVTETKTSPMWGVFGTWNMNKDGNGLSVQGSAAYAASELNVGRTSSAVTEAGQGKTQFNGQAYQLQANYAQPVSDATKLIPYLGLRYTRINQGAYTENSNAQVLYPVSYNAMAQNTFSAIAGVGVQSHLAEKLKGKIAVGLQQNLNYSMGNYAGVSSIPGMTSFSTAMPSSTNTMATANGGLYYDVRKNEQIGLTALWQQQPFINTNTTSVIASYTIGF